MLAYCISACSPPVSQDTLDYKKKQRPLKIRMLDATVKTVMVDDSKIVSDMLMTICARIGRCDVITPFTCVDLMSYTL